jgi:hypothetical protein
MGADVGDIVANEGAEDVQLNAASLCLEDGADVIGASV